MSYGENLDIIFLPTQEEFGFSAVDFITSKQWFNFVVVCSQEKQKKYLSFATFSVSTCVLFFPTLAVVTL